VWVDIVSVRQYAQNEDMLAIPAIIKSIRNVIVVLDPWDKPLSLQRAWCLLEIAHCFRVRGTLTITLPTTEHGRMLRALARDREAVINKLTAFDIRTAGTQSDEDYEALLHIINNDVDSGGNTGFGGIHHFNTSTRHALTVALSSFSCRGC